MIRSDRSRAHVVVVGGGPAGAATALSLVARGVPCTLLEASESIPRKVGETVPPGLASVLERLALDGLLREPAHLVCHGNEYVWGDAEPVARHFLSHPIGNAWHLDRRAFEEDLRKAARCRGVDWRCGSRVLGTARNRADGWRLAIAEGGEEREIAARFVVDATGRASRIARLLGERRRRHDNLIGVVCRFGLRAGNRVPQLTCIEATEQGWWYAALLPDNVLMTSFMTDSDLLDGALLDPDSYRARLAGTRLIGSYLGGWPPQSLDSAPLVRSASTSHLPRLFGDGWLAVGDAACAYDPISSYGILSAVGGGVYAGHAIADHLDGRGEALPAYALVVGQAYEAYMEMARNQYRLEGRWPDSPFWKRRQ